jgi:hypothetical protein
MALNRTVLKSSAKFEAECGESDTRKRYVGIATNARVLIRLGSHLLSASYGRCRAESTVRTED